MAREKRGNLLHSDAGFTGHTEGWLVKIVGKSDLKVSLIFFLKYHGRFFVHVST